MKIGLIVAMQKELNLYLSRKENNLQNENISCKFSQFRIKEKDIIACLSGMGKVNAAIHTTEMIHKFNPDIILNIGFSGGIDESVEIGDFVIGSQISYHDVWCGEPNCMGQVQDLPPIYQSSSELVQKISDVDELKKGMLCCGDQFITAKEKLKEIKRLFPQAVAVDMESAAIAQTCFIYKKPLLCIRQISDVVGKEYQNEQYQNFWLTAPQKSYDICQKIITKL